MATAIEKAKAEKLAKAVERKRKYDNAISRGCKPALEVSVVATATTFSTGSIGYMYSNKLEQDGKRYQVTVSVTEIDSKP